MNRHKLNYFKDSFNYLDNGAILFPLLIIPFRMTALPVQWVFASLGYLCQTLRGLEFAAAFRYKAIQVILLLVFGIFYVCLSDQQEHMFRYYT